jgi:hypothetical protein
MRARRLWCKNIEKYQKAAAVLSVAAEPRIGRIKADGRRGLGCDSNGFGKHLSFDTLNRGACICMA